MTVLNLFWTVCTVTHIFTNIHELVILRYLEDIAICVGVVAEMTCCNNKEECKDMSGPAGDLHTPTQS